jgi:hypothetical protein
MAEDSPMARYHLAASIPDRNPDRTYHLTSTPRPSTRNRTINGRTRIRTFQTNWDFMRGKNQWATQATQPPNR